MTDNNIPAASPDQQKAYALGFDPCEFHAEDPEDICERCGKVPEDGVLFFRGTPGDGEYACLPCIMIEDQENQETLAAIAEHEAEGHTNHCASRQVWGDGNCECGKQGAIPGAISRTVEMAQRDCCKKQYWVCSCGASPMGTGPDNPPTRCSNTHCNQQEFRFITTHVCCQKHHHHIGATCPHCGEKG